MSTAELFANDWSPDGWRRRSAAQQPDWPDADALEQVEAELRGLPPLVFAGEARTLTESLAAAQDGRAFLLVAGDCAESFQAFSADAIRDKLRVILQMSVVLTYGTGVPTIKVGRMAGQFTKPRSSATEARGGVELPSFRGDTINDQPASELASGTRFEDLPAAFPTERFRLGSEDPTVKAIEWLTPFGKGSRVAIIGASRAGKSEALRRLAAVLAGQDELQVSVALAGVRPEEISVWSEDGLAAASAVSFSASSDAQDHAVELVVDQARRVAARGADAVVLIDTLDGLHPQAARKALGAARNIVDGGSLTVIATAAVPVGGETTVIALDLALASTGRFPAVNLAASGTLRAELLVGDAGAEAIARGHFETAMAIRLSAKVQDLTSAASDRVDRGASS